MSGRVERAAAIAEDLLSGMSGRELAARAGLISAGYREHLPSNRLIRDETDAAIYALMRMPATGAAVDHVFEALMEREPHFSPASVHDAGAGPGTAGLVASEFWPDAELTLSDAHAGLLALAQRILVAEGRRARVERSDLHISAEGLAAADLVVASYALTELDDAAYTRIAEHLWHAAAKVLVVIEPGRPRDYARLMAFRSWAVGQGARIVAPCPHADECPLIGSDWCHFSVRLQRGRTHRLLKSATLGYEDEKFSYLVLARDDVALSPARSRVLAPPEVKKHETRLKLCEPDGQEAWRGFSKKDPHFGQIRRLKWGDALPFGDESVHE